MSILTLHNTLSPEGSALQIWSMGFGKIMRDALVFLHASQLGPTRDSGENAIYFMGAREC